MNTCSSGGKVGQGVRSDAPAPPPTPWAAQITSDPPLESGVTVTLSVVISLGHGAGPATVTGFQVVIPPAGGGAGELTNDVGDIQASGPEGWGTTPGPAFRFTPPGGSVQVMPDSSVMLQLTSVAVNAKPGPVAIRVYVWTQGSPDASEIDCLLTKAPAGFKVSPLSANPIMTSGNPGQTTLSWVGSGNLAYSPSYSLEWIQGGRPISKAGLPASEAGYPVDGLTGTTAFTLIVDYVVGQTSQQLIRQVTVSVPIPGPSIKSFSAVWRGQKLELQWATENADSVELSDVPGERKKSGSLLLDPSQQPLPASFTLTATATGLPAASSRLVRRGFRPAAVSPIAVAGGASSVGVSPDGLRVFVANGNDHTLTVFDALTLEPVGSPIAAGRGPNSVAVSPDGTRVFVADLGGNQDGNTLTVLVNGQTLVPLGPPVAVGKGPWCVAVSPDGTRVFVVNSGDNTLSVLANGPTLAPVGSPVAVGFAPTSVAVSPDGTRLFVANRGYVGNWGQTLTVLSNGPSVGPVGPPVAVGNGPCSVAVSPDGRRVFVANSGDNTLTVLECGQSLEPVGRPVPVGLSPSFVAVSPDGALVFVANEFSNNLTVLDAHTFEAVEGSPVPVGAYPFSIALAPAGGRVFVANVSDSTLTVLDPAAYLPAQ